MRKADRFRDRHKEMLDIANEISLHLNENELSEDATSVLSKFFRKLNVHLAMEDNVLYPQLINYSDAKIKEIATVSLIQKSV